MISVAGVLTDYASGKKIFPLFLKWLAKGLLSILGLFFPLDQFFYAFLQDYALTRFPTSLHMDHHLLLLLIVFSAYPLSLIFLLLEIVMKTLLCIFFMLFHSFFSLNCSLLLTCSSMNLYLLVSSVLTRAVTLPKSKNLVMCLITIITWH